MRKRYCNKTAKTAYVKQNGGVMDNLIIEAADCGAVKGRSFEKFGAIFDVRKLGERQARAVGRKAGNYITVQTNDKADEERAVKYAFSALTKRNKRVLVVGMGNGDVAADALGKKVVEYLKKMGTGDKISVFAPDVGALTNLDSVRLVKAVAQEFSPDYVIAVDALATAKPERLGSCFQFTDSSLSPGGGVGKGGYMDSAVLKTRFIAVGVPFIISACDLCGYSADGHYVPYNVDETADRCAKVIAKAVLSRFSRNKSAPRA